MEFWKWQQEQQKNSNNNQQSQNGHQRDRQGQDRQGQTKYVGAPYNFVPFYDKVFQYPEHKLTKHNSVEEKLITGELTYKITAETPIMVDDGTGKFFTDAKGRYAIPGSTMRGLIRNNVQVLGLCSYDNDIDNYALMYRNVANGAEKRRYNNTLGAKQISVSEGEKNYSLGVLLNVRAGYVSNEGGKYVIYQTAVDSIKNEFNQMNYYVLSERKIVHDYLKYGKDFSYSFFRQNGKSILQHEFEKFERYERNGIHYKGKKNKAYKPYYEPVSYEVTHEKDIAAVGRPGKYKKAGFAVSTGAMNEKKAVYIIPEIDQTKECIVISEADIRAFKIDLKKKENTLKQFGGKKYFDLPEEGKMRPVFYIRLDGRLYFGFTPRLRLFYEHMLKEGLKQKWKADSVDYSRALFGYATPEKSCKSKVSFSDAVLQGTIKKGAEKKLILAEPKPTSYLDYLKQNGNTAVTYNTDDFELHGAKQYWLHKSLVPVEKTVTNEKAASMIAPLEQGAEFIGKVRFQNLTEDELGLLLWAIRLNQGSQMNVGKAKAYGYGRISLKITETVKIDRKLAYQSDAELCLNPFTKVDVDRTIEYYKTEINQYLGKPIDELPHIQEFFLMKDSGRIPDNKQTRYMKIDAKEYQSRTEALPAVQSVIPNR